MNKKLLLVLYLLLFGVSGICQDVIKGTVYDSSGEILPGVNVLVKGTTTGTITDFDGHYALKAEKDAVLVYSFIGMIPQEHVVNKDVIDIYLKTDATEISEVVAIGYGREKKSLNAGTISKVADEELTAGVVLDAAQSLQGRAAGVVVQSGSGQPGDGMSVNIRGLSTTGNSQPLYVVDGMPVSNISFLNPSDIESMEVLKDAAAASIYGARGGNGVIIISTKGSGKKSERLSVTYDGYYGVQNPWKKQEVLNAKEYAIIINEMYLNDNKPAPFDPEAVGAGTDWWDQIENPNAPVQNHSLNFSGGSEHSTFNSSLSYFSQEGTFAKGKSDYERMTGRLNSNHEYGIVTIGTSMSFAHFTTSGFDPNNGLAGGAMMTSALNYDPTAPIRDEEGDFYFSPNGTNEFTNPIAMLETFDNETVGDRFLGNVYADFEIVEGLNFKTSVSVDGNFMKYREFKPKFYYNANIYSDSPSMSENSQNTMQWQVENTLNYKKNFDKHGFSILLGQSALNQQYNILSGSGNKLMFDDFPRAWLGTSLDAPGTMASSERIEYRLASYFGRINYNYDEKYIINAVLRADGSSRFAPDKKFGYFPSIAGAWVLSKESFLKDNPIVSFAKIRASWGQNGNDQIGNFAYTSLLGRYTYTLGEKQDVTAGLAPMKISNPDLLWETIVQTNIGLDMGFLNNQLSFMVDYYEKSTKDILITPDVPAHAGTDAPSINGGTVKNSGLEMEVSYKGSKGQLNYNIAGTLTYNKNEMTEINNESKMISGASAGLSLINATVALEGHPIGAFYGVKTDGVFQNQGEIDNHVSPDGTLLQPNAKPGDLRFVNRNNDNFIDGSDRTILGSPFPKYTAGLNLSLDYKGFDFSAFLYGAFDYQIFNSIRRYDYAKQNWSTTVFDRWTGEGTSSDVPRLTQVDPNGNYSTVSDYFLEDVNMLRLKKVTLGYSLPKSVVSTVGLSKARFYLAADNLVTWTSYSGLDPEIGASDPNNPLDRGIDHGVFPQSRTYLFGVNLTF